MKNFLFISNNFENFENLESFISSRIHQSKINCTDPENISNALSDTTYHAIFLDISENFEPYFQYLSEAKTKLEKIPIITLCESREKLSEFLIPFSTELVEKNSDYLNTLYSTLCSIIQNKTKNGFINSELILSSIDSAIIVTDISVNIIYWNNCAEKLFGWNSVEVIGKPLNLVLKFDFGKNNPDKDILNIIKNDFSWHGEFLTKNKDGVNIFAELKLNPIKDDNNNVIAVSGTYKDITTKKENEKKLHLLSDIILNVSDGIILTDLDNNIIFINETKAKMSGYSPEEVIGKNILILAKNDPGLEQQMLEVTNKILNEGIWSGELEEITKDGKHITISLSNRLLKNDEGIPYGIVGISQDISAKKKLEVQVKESEEWYRTIVANINGILIFLDINGNIEYINGPAETIFGYNVGEIKGKKYVDLFVTDKIQKKIFEKTINSILNGQSIKGFNTTVKIRDNQLRDIIYNIGPRYSAKGDIIGVLANGIDVTDLRILERQLAETNTYIENIISNSADGIITFDINKKVVTWNKACEKIYGYSSEEVIGKTLEFTVPEEYKKEWNELYDDVIKGNTFKNLEIERIKKDGSRIYLLVTISPILGLQKRIIGISSFIKDITEKKLLEKQAYLSEVKYRQLFEESKDFIFETSIGGKFISINQAGVDLLGYKSKDEIMELDIAKNLYYNPEERKRFKAEIAKNGYVIDYEVQLKKNSGEKITFIETATTIYDDNGNIIGYRGIGRDITEQKKHQERILSLLIASQAFSRATTDQEIFETISKAIRRLDHNLIIMIKEGNILKIVQTSFDSTIIKGAEKLYNFKLENIKIPYKKFSDFKKVIENKTTAFNDKAIDRLIEVLPSHIPKNIIESITKEIGFKNRSIILPLTIFNEVIGIAVINSDEFSHKDIPVFNLYSAHLNAALENARLYTRLKKVNDDLKTSYEKLHQSQTLLVHSEKMKAIGDLASGVAHDFNNLLGVIIGRSQLLQLRTTDQKTKSDLEVILKAALDGAETVKRLQDFAKQRVEDNASAIDVNMIIEDTIQLTQTKWKDFAQQRGAKIEIKKEFAHLPIIFGSGSELREILTNLIINAVDAMPNGGNITIRTKNLERLYSIEVEDTGTGMDSETLSKIFTPFYTTKGERGTGLGLAMVKTLVLKRLGEINVKSETGKGTLFTIIFPKVNIENEKLDFHLPENPKPEIAIEHKALNILIIDDEEELRILLAEILREANHKVLLAKDGKEGLEKFNSGNIDIVFTDLGMPEINGWQVAQAVKEKNPNVPVILISGWGRDLNDQDISNTGVDFLASKPFHIDEIFQLLINAKNFIAERKK